MLLTDLIEVKKLLEIPPGKTDEDAKLNFFIEQASSWILEFLGRPGLGYAVRTEYYDGTGTQQLLLRSRPVRTTPTIEVYFDEMGFYGSTSGSFDPSPTTGSALTFGEDFCLVLDLDNQRSRSGVLVRINNLWPKPFARQRGYLSPFVADAFGNVKVTYGGGYTVDDLPAQLRFACTMLVARMRYLMPLGMELGSESYEERHISLISDQRNYLLGSVKQILWSFRNWKF